MKKFFFFVCFFGFLPQISLSQEKIVEKGDIEGLYKLSDVVISATKTANSTLELASSVTIIDSAEVENRNSALVLELLKNEYGISTTTQGGKGSLSNIYIRGGSSAHTLVLVDGIETNLVSDPQNVYDFSGLTADNIQSIEILRSPQSTLYGSNSLSGVINIVTKKGNSDPNFSLLSEIGSYKTFRNTLGMNGKIADFNYSATFGRSESEGFSAASTKLPNPEKDGFRKDNISVRLGYELSNTDEINIIMNYLNSNSDYDQTGGEFGDDPTYKFDQEEFSFVAQTKFDLFEGLWNQQVQTSILRNVRRYNFDYSEFNQAASNSHYDGLRLKFDWQNNLKLIDHYILTFGLSAASEQASSEYFYFSPFYNFESIFPKKNIRTVGAYAQNQFNYEKSLFLVLGVRLDHHDNFGFAFTYRIAPSFILWNSKTKFKATLGSGFKAPSLFNLFDPVYGNPNLKPEKSLGFDAGIEQFFTHDLFSFGATYFQNNYSDLIGFDPSFKAINLNKAKTNGVETYLTSRFAGCFKIKMNYTFTNAKDESEGIQDSERKLIRRPEHKIGSYISYDASEHANLNLDFIYVGSREDLVFDNTTFSSSRVKLEPYFLINFSASYQILKYLRFHFRIENLLNANYQEVYGYSTAGFSVYGGIKLSINSL